MAETGSTLNPTATPATIRERIDRYLDGIDLPEAARTAFIGLLRGMRLQDRAVGLAAWSPAPDVTLVSAKGRPLRLSSLLAKGHLVLTFIRATDNPFCRIQLEAYAEIDQQLLTFGTRQAAVAVQEQADINAMVADLQLPFPVYADPSREAAQAYGLITQPSSALVALRQGLESLDLSPQQEFLPSPGSYLIDRTGVIHSAFVDPDFSERWEPADILKAARSLALH